MIFFHHLGSTDGNQLSNHCFQGELEVTTERGTGKGKASTAEADIVERVPFLLLALDLPAAPLFKDVLEKNIIPQVCECVWGGPMVTKDIYWYYEKNVGT